MQTLDQRIYVGSVGITIDLACRDYNYALLDLSAASDVFISIRKPDGYEQERTAQVASNTDNNPATHEIIRYVTVEDDLDVVGEYLIQAKILFASGAIWYSETQKITVYDLFDKE